MSDATETIEFIKDAGGCLVSRSILEGTTPLKWMFREESVNPADNGWRFIGLDDDDDFINTPGNTVVADWNTVATVEPAILETWSMPVGSDLQLVREAGRIRIFDNTTDSEVFFS